MRDKRDKNGFKHFYFFQRATPDLILKITRDNPIAASVYMLLLHCSSNMGACIVSEPAIANFVHRSVRTVTRAIRYLSSNYYLLVAHSGRSNVYILNFNQVWGTRNAKKDFIRSYVNFPVNATICNDKENRSFFKALRSFSKHHVNKMIDFDKLDYSSRHNLQSADKHSKRNVPIRQIRLMHNKAQQTSLFDKNTNYNAHMTKLSDDDNKKSAHK